MAVHQTAGQNERVLSTVLRAGQQKVKRVPCTAPQPLHNLRKGGALCGVPGPASLHQVAQVAVGGEEPRWQLLRRGYDQPAAAAVCLHV